MYAAYSLPPPTAHNMIVCYGFVCGRRVQLNFDVTDRRRLAAILAAGQSSAAADRKAVAQAVLWFDRRVGPLAGTVGRIARADIRNARPGQNFDCIDSSYNATSFLLVLQHWGLLRHHRVDPSRFRGNLLLGQTPHNTAVLIEHAGGREWSVDMWTRAYGEPPEIMPVEVWLRQN
jgi:hypothetical protein